MRLVERRPPVAHLVALRRLDLDDLGAVVAQDLGAVRPAQHPGEIEHEDPVERALGHGKKLRPIELDHKPGLTIASGR